MPCKTSVVIPYYQEKPGILRGAVLSAVAQEGVNDLEIIVVDDGSPAPARDDLENLDLPAHVTLKLIEQPNRGPGAARNCALDNISPWTVYVAFLDSDDRWTPWHLSAAQRALDSGYDVYFADFWLSIHDQSTFNRYAPPFPAHSCINKSQSLYRFVSHPDVEILDGLCSTPTLVYRLEQFRDLRFPEIFWIGEDRAFVKRLTDRSRLIIFSRQIGCVSGSGVNIFASATWDSPRCVWRLVHSMRWRKWMTKSVALSEAEKRSNRRHIRRLRREFSLVFLHELRELRVLRDPNIARFFIENPIALVYLPTAAFEALARHLRRLLLPPTRPFRRE